MTRLPSKTLLAPAIFLSIAGALVLTAPVALAGSATLNWDPVADADLAGYKVYYGTSPGVYPNVQDVGNVTTVTLNNLTDCTLYYFAVKAYDTAGNVSAVYSNEISGMARPTVGGVSPSSANQNASGVSLTITGTNFRTGATVTFSGTGITVNSVSVGSCTTLTASVSIAATAATGARSVTVKNADQSSGTGSNLFTVNLADLTAPVISATASAGVTTSGATITWTTNEASSSQVAYRAQGSGTYTNTSLNSSLVTSHSVTLSGLNAATVYEYHVMSTDAAGNTATSTPDGTLTTKSFNYVTVEAESGTLTSPMASHNDFDTPLAFNGNYIWTPAGTGANTNGNPTAKATYAVTLANSGTYTLWVRMYAVTANNDSFWQSLDSGTKTTLTAGNLGVWAWTKGATFTVTAGSHSLVLGHRDEQTRADQIILTDDAAFVPVAAPTDSTLAVLSAVSAGSLTSSGATVTWTSNEPSDSQVEYGLSTSYGLASPVDSTLVLGHSVTLTALQSATVYHYRVVSKDRGGNVTRSADFTFTTAAPLDVTPPANVQNLRRGDTSP
ncbi:MAG TPA: fibronectin type III domain-containing protein [Candidatus Polarisedimenticolia bacterium]|nr:fibronectin type III domain-containing protein [Candidatus Polarisedimenticolia bacterium]